MKISKKKEIRKKWLEHTNYTSERKRGEESCMVELISIN